MNGDARNDQSALDHFSSTDAFEQLATSCGMSKEEFLRQWNKGAAYADKHWADNPAGDGYDYNQPGILHDKFGDPIFKEKGE